VVVGDPATLDATAPSCDAAELAAMAALSVGEGFEVGDVVAGGGATMLTEESATAPGETDALAGIWMVVV